MNELSPSQVADILYDKEVRPQEEALFGTMAKVECVRRRLKAGVHPLVRERRFDDFEEMYALEQIGEDQAWKEDIMDKHFGQDDCRYLYMSIWPSDRDVYSLSRKLEHVRGNNDMKKNRKDAWNAFGMTEHQMHIGNLIVRQQKKMWKILRCTIHPQVRRMGIGSKAIVDLQGEVQRARDGEVRGLQAEIADENETGQLFLDKCGFSYTGCIDRGKGKHQYVMKWYK